MLVRTPWLLQISLLLAVLATSACSPTGVQPATDLPPAAKTVVIIPDIPDTLIVATRGVTIFGNHLDQPDIANWKLPNLIYTTARKALPQQYQVSEALPQGPQADATLAAALVATDNAKALVRFVPLTTNPDLYVVFTTNFVDTPSAPYFMLGIGVSNQLQPFGLPPLVPSVIAHSYLDMKIVDGKTFKILADNLTTLPPGTHVTHGAFADLDDRYPEQPLKGFVWHDNWVEMTPDQQALIRSTIETLLRMSVNYTVKTAFAPQ